ncbi:TRAP transporter large permease [Tepidanaerobacter sp. GT38]|uniref:TRAP transporter large permease n=1 Tax=Tepidanaerobacter sp. GT38 TaxID=2722793 RepID=UPI001F419FE6|nr:TRAP transporter large permease [Tepidanaerobacter sp. GT38]MCG1011523.1 TRAP transporter large permease [Tepidanaerobacter sp. GT38]
MSFELAVFLLVFTILFALKAPIWASLLISSSTYILLTGEQLSLIARKTVAGMDSFVLMAIPMFILAAELMNCCDITTHLFNFAKSIVGWIPGGMANANVLASMLFAGMSGSSAADVAGLGTMEIKAMTDDGYDKAFSAAVTAASSTVGPIIPPSIPMVVYSSITGASIGKLFLGGVIPGILMGIAMMVICYLQAIKRNYPRLSSISLRNIVEAFIKALPGLIAPVILFVGIYTGYFTPTEAAAVAAIYALAIGVFLYKNISLQQLRDILIKTAVNTAIVLFIIGAANLFGYVLTSEQIPIKLTGSLLTISENPYVMLLIFNIIFLILGCFMEINAIMLIFLPVILPVLKSLNIDLVHFGVITVFNLMIGTITPPFGMMLYMSAAIADEPLHKVISELVPFFIVLISVLLLITYVPGLVLFLPNLIV